MHGSFALCSDCHGKHDIRKKTDPASRAYSLNIPRTCTGCHQGKVKESYDYSFHGTAVRLGYRSAANCADCHGAHDVLRQDHPESNVAPANLPVTCGRCHFRPRANFAQGKEHVVPADKARAPYLYWTWKVFLGLILFDLGKDGSIVIFELWRKLRRKPDPPGPAGNHETNLER